MKFNCVGYLMMRNLLVGGFNGLVFLVMLVWKVVLGVLVWLDIVSLFFIFDFVVLCINVSCNFVFLEEFGEKGCKICIIFFVLVL